MLIRDSFMEILCARFLISQSADLELLKDKKIFANSSDLYSSKFSFIALWKCVFMSSVPTLCKITLMFSSA